jgi:hypothetical protein
LIGEWELALHGMQVAYQLDDDYGGYELLKEYREKEEAARTKRIELEKKKEAKRDKRRARLKLLAVDEEEEGELLNFGGAGAGCLI